MDDSIEELKEVLYYAQEVENQSLINSCAEELAIKMLDLNPHLDYNELLFQYGFSNTGNSILKKR